EVHVTADAILKAAGKTFKGKDGGSIKVLGVEENGGNVTIKFEFDAPRDVVPGQGVAGLPGGLQQWNVPGGGIQILPAPAPALPQAKGAFQVQVQVQQIQIVGGGIALGNTQYGTQGLELLDEKGNVIPCIGNGTQLQGGPGGFQAIHV